MTGVDRPTRLCLRARDQVYLTWGGGGGEEGWSLVVMGMSLTRCESAAKREAEVMFSSFNSPSSYGDVWVHIYTVTIMYVYVI